MTKCLEAGLVIRDMSSRVSTSPRRDQLVTRQERIQGATIRRAVPVKTAHLGHTVVDFRKQLGAKKSLAKPTDPIQLYQTLDRASDKGPLRPAQEAILSEWHQTRRNDKDVIIKMHTGQGKTLIGLLVLQSKLNEDAGPALYLCPNNHLVEQTVEQAKQFGITCCTAPGDLPAEFLEGKEILVTSVQRLFNGRTKFKLGPYSQEVAALVMDDAHACIDAIRDSCIIRIPKEHRVYEALMLLFGSDLKEQGAGTFADIRAHKYDALLAVPYWSWMDRHHDVATILSKDAATEELKYVWPLLKDILRDCVCLVSGAAIEISPNAAPLYLFGSYSEAAHRVYMSATVTNDAFLVKGLGLSPKVITSPMVDKNEKWSGEKMIVIPSLISSDLNREAMIRIHAPASDNRKYGRVVLTPSFEVAAEWGNAGAVVADKKTIYSLIEQLKTGKVTETLVVANRYDGIDLPDSACRILILDSKPYSETLVDRWTESAQRDSDVISTRIARTIEQGLGRSVRGEKDYSVIILTGPDLIKMIRARKFRTHFSSQTQAQIELGLEIAELAKEDIAGGEKPESALQSLMNQCLTRQDAWKQFYADRMSKIRPSAPDPKSLTLFTAERQAEAEFQGGQPERATATLQELIDKHVPNEIEQGWYLQEMARYVYLSDKSQSNKLQIAAHQRNRYLLKPKDGMKVTNISAIGQKRLDRMIEWARGFGTPAELLLEIDDILSRLRFGVASDSFEAAFDELGQALGFPTQRPDKEWKEGPDNLWALRDNQYLLVECKNMVDMNRKEVNKDETGQMNNSCAWFRTHYGDVPVKNIMIIWTRFINHAGGFNEAVEITTDSSLARLGKNVREFFRELRTADLQDLSEKKLQANLVAYQLTVDDLVARYSEPPILK